MFVDAKIDPLLENQFAAGRLYAAISSRPGQSGRADGYILEGRELEVCLQVCFLLNCAEALFAVLYQEVAYGQAKACTVNVAPTWGCYIWMMVLGTPLYRFLPHVPCSLCSMSFRS